MVRCMMAPKLLLSWDLATLIFSKYSVIIDQMMANRKLMATINVGGKIAMLRLGQRTYNFYRLMLGMSSL